MHEMSIASRLVDQLLRIMNEQNVARIVEVEVHCGVMQQVVPEALELAFEAVTMGTAAAGSKLKIVEVGVSAKCRACGTDYEADLENFTCPSCGRAEPELIAGQDIMLQSVVCETEDEAAT